MLAMWMVCLGNVHPAGYGRMSFKLQKITHWQTLNASAILFQVVTTYFHWKNENDSILFDVAIMLEGTDVC